MAVLPGRYALSRCWSISCYGPRSLVHLKSNKKNLNKKIKMAPGGSISVWVKAATSFIWGQYVLHLFNPITDRQKRNCAR
ncbi:hypothetical protein FKM82_021498 [Ascaphus truei]